MLELTVAVLIMLVGSAVCSGTETALLSVPLLKARQLAQATRHPNAAALLAIREQINRPIATIVILNNLFNIVGSIVIGSIAAAVFGDALLGVFSAALTFAVILVAEILPKTLGERYAESIALWVAMPVRTLTWAMTPVVWLLEQIMAPFVRGYERPITNETEIKLLASIGYQEGIIEADEAEMIRRVFRLNDVKAADIMTPRVALTYLRCDRTLADAQDIILNSQHSRILVTEADIDRVLGMVLKDELLSALIRGEQDTIASQWLRPVRFAAETERADQLLQTFQSSREHLAVVVDEYGGISGVVTLEDVLEILTGEIVDETDRNVDLQALARQRRKRLLQSRGFGDVSH
ncbi:Magnesium and cobalt efflux CorC domain protein [Halomicronema hongdechloris C2206]|uniref:Magnesium and cobalt efflux CorC domain protein n=1 Tax=Halomicronema hongdechloris C2206 TaxID=1641165 RepID=A0A1Z3HRG7_9CYAN|nr:hemolysin family protein [Halomicronema hongdechloris]ASC72919.1 Magnesium and cobalt efflux CorC domain protein [Halomicronema hongdechloris C2206]